MIGVDLAESRVECYISLKEFPESGPDAQIYSMKTLAGRKSNPGNTPV
jgi:hypothetical protein